MATNPTPLPKLGQFLRGLQAYNDWFEADLYRQVGPHMMPATFGRRIASNDWTLLEAYGVCERIADLFKIDFRAIWLNLTAGERTDPLLDDITSASHIWVADPDRIALLSGVLERHEQHATRMLSWSRFLAVSFMGCGIIEPHIHEYAHLAGSAGKLAAPASIQFGLERHERFNSADGFGAVRDACQMLFRSDFALLPYMKWPFSTCHPKMVNICLRNLIKDVVLGREILIWLVEDMEPGFPRALREHFERFDHVVAMDNKFVTLRWRNSFDRAWFERTDKASLANARIDSEMKFLNDLTEYVHYRTPSEVAEELRKYLPC